MSAQTLRRAASLMRERAASCLSRDDSWYTANEVMGALMSVDPPSSGLVVDADHIAAFDPRSALALAEWLEAEADRPTSASHYGVGRALDFARAYLGGDA